MNFNEELKQRVEQINALLAAKLPAEEGMQQRVAEAMNYSVNAGGKRLRPMLLLEVYRLLGGTDEKITEPFMAALECIHTYSLVHDDLPAMDNDDYRRGKYTNHKVFGEAMALLAGDGLLTLAFEVMLEQKNVPPEVLVEVVREVAMCAGNFGMVGGQALDLDAEGKQISEAELRKLHSGKTGAMFIAAVRGGAHLAGATSDQLLALTHFADLLGLAFQITDDILDVEGDPAEMGKSAGSDEKKHKSTYVSLYTLAGAKALAEKTVAEALECLDSFGEKAEPLRRITKMMCGRKS